MSKQRSHGRKPASAPAPKPGGSRAGFPKILIAVIALAGVAVAIQRATRHQPPPPAGGTNASPASPGVPATAATTAATATNSPPATESMEAAQSVVVVKDLDFGGKAPPLSEVMREIDRRSTTDSGQGRAFSILEAFDGSVQPDGRVRVALRISTEEPGVGEIVFRRTGEVLWRTRVTPAVKSTPQPKNLTVLFHGADGTTSTVDGSTGPATIFVATLKEPGKPVVSLWPDGEEREFTFLYSVCGCPVKVHVRRKGDRSERTVPNQVVFPDDPEVAEFAGRLMRW